MVKVDKLNGKKVIGANGNIVGDVNGLELDLADWRAKYIYVDLSESAAKALGTKTSFWSTTTICLPITTINQVGDVITLNVNANDLKGIAECPGPTPPAAMTPTQ